MSKGCSRIKYSGENLQVTVIYEIPLFCLDKAYGKAYDWRMNTISATKARTNLYDLIDEVSKTGKRIGITKFGVLKAVLISNEEYECMFNKSLEASTSADG